MKRADSNRKNGPADKLNPAGAPTTRPASSAKPATAGAPKPRTPVSKRAALGSSVTLPAAQVEAKPTLDDIRRRAYEIYLGRQSTGRAGNSDSDWAQAERELIAVA